MNITKSTYYTGQYWSPGLRYDILRLKNHSDKEAAKRLADKCLPDIRELIRKYDIDALAYVPSANRSHMSIFANIVGERLKIKVWHGIIKRYGVPSLCTCPSTAARREIIRNAFYMSGEGAPVKVLLIDNVITTGSTLSELTDLLETHFVHVVRYTISAVHKKK